MMEDDDVHELAEQTAVAILVASATVAGPVPGAIATAAAPILQTALHAIFNSLRDSRVRHAAEALLDAATESGATTADAFAEFVMTAVSDERSQELLARALIVAQDTASRAKRRAAGRSIAAAVADKGTKIDEELIFLRVLDDLDVPHFRLLNLMATEPPPNYGDPGRPRAAVPKGWMRADLIAADPGFGDAIGALLSGLQRHGLVNVGELRNPNGVQEPIYTVTNYGHRFLTRMTDPASDP